jgi:hypothetical protein
MGVMLGSNWHAKQPHDLTWHIQFIIWMELMGNLGIALDELSIIVQVFVAVHYAT